MGSNNLKKLALIGAVDAGKSALLNSLIGHEVDVATGKTQAPVYYPNQLVDTPGEFIDNRAWYGALLSTISNIPIIVYLHAADSEQFAAPFGILQVYSSKKIVGVISKTDADGADLKRANHLLSINNIPKPYFEVSINDAASIDRLRKHLLEIEVN